MRYELGVGHQPQVIMARNVNGALEEGLHWLAVAGRTADSRNGPVLVAPGPVITMYSRPWERVLFSALRDANPFFHLYECVWMVAGRNDAAAVGHYAKTMEEFADEDGKLHGAYGYRWRDYFGQDQLQEVIATLKANPSTRRCVLTMWSPVGDLFSGAGGGNTSKDLPCNTHVYFDASSGLLNMTVCNRSNDIVWGAYGANAVHMSFLHELIAVAIGRPQGAYYQFSNNFHTYIDRPDVARLITPREPRSYGYNVHYVQDDRYQSEKFINCPLWEPVRDFDFDQFVDSCDYLAAEYSGYERILTTEDVYSHFLRRVFVPMMKAHAEYKAGNYETAKIAVRLCDSVDWATAGLEWIERRERAAAVRNSNVT